MAKKVLTPEQAEIKAMKKAKKSENWTKFWAILLAAVLTVAVVFMGQTAAEDAIAKATAGQPTDGTETNDGGSSSTQDPWNDGSTGTDAGTSAPAGDAGTSAPAGDAGNNAGGNAAASNEKAELVKTLNQVTAAAAKGSYSFERVGKWIETVDVGSATSTLNGVVETLAPGSNVDTIVGGFLGLNTLNAQVANGKYVSGKKDGGVDIDVAYHNSPESNKLDFLMKGMTLQESDIASYSKSGNTYTFTIPTTITPSANSPLGRATNDYVTFDKVNAALKKDAAGMVSVNGSESEAVYENIKFTATIVDGKLTALEYSYVFSAELSLKITVLPANGTGKAQVTNKITNIKY